MNATRTRTRLLLLALTGALWLAAPHATDAVSCPNSGAKLQVVINNPTSTTLTSGVTISGNAINGLVTCTDQASSFTWVADSTHTLAPGLNTITIPNSHSTPSTGGLNTGVWVHKIAVSIGSNVYNEYQKGVVLEAPNSASNPYSTANWTYFPNSTTVNTAGDAGTGTCTTNCTLRQAITKANSATRSASSPFLIVFSTSPGAMSQTSELIVSGGGGGYVTVDGTNSAGNPWIVGDALASQDAFPTVVDLSNLTKFHLYGPNNTLKGLAITNTTSSGTPQLNLVTDYTQPNNFPDGTNTTLQNLRLDGGAASITSCSGGCASRLIDSVGTGTTISNVDGRAAYGSAVYAPQGLSSPPAIADSWFHHNLSHNLYVNNASISRNFVELAGFNLSNNTSVNTLADGILGSGGSNIVTSRNVVRDNNSFGHEVTATNQTPALSLSHDYVCGNGGVYGGTIVYGGSGPANGTGLTAAYNSNYGIFFDTTILSGAMTFDNDSAFTANGSAGLRNNSTAITVSAKNNQWRTVTGNPIPSCNISSNTDVSGLVSCDPAQDYLNVAIVVSSTHPVVPSNVIRSGQTIRVQGTGFNAIDGNPVGGGAVCTTGPGADTGNCCRKPSKANTCDGSTPPNGQAGKGNCVALRNGSPTSPTWVAQSPTAVTPTTVALGLAASFQCIGQQNELARVSKLKSDGTPAADQQAFCTNTDPKP